MKNVGNGLAVAAIILLIYSVIARFTAGQTVPVGVTKISGITGLTVANSLMLVGLVIKMWDK